MNGKSRAMESRGTALLEDHITSLDEQIRKFTRLILSGSNSPGLSTVAGPQRRLEARSGFAGAESPPLLMVRFPKAA